MIHRATTALGLLCVASLLGCGEIKRFMYEGFGRDDWQKPERVISVLDLKPGDRVADIGAGGGYFTFRLADAVGPEGVVYAVDVDAEMTEHLEAQIREKGYGNITTVLAEFEDPKIPGDGSDLIFLSNTYHHLQDRSAYFTRAATYLKENGRVAIVEYRKSGFFAGLLDHSTSADVIQSEMEAAGFALAQQHDFLPRQHFLVFRRNPRSVGFGAP